MNEGTLFECIEALLSNPDYELNAEVDESYKNTGLLKVTWNFAGKESLKPACLEIDVLLTQKVD